MIFIVDAQLPPALAQYLTSRFGVQARHVRELGLRDADDRVIHRHAAASGAVVITKDSDFVASFTATARHHGSCGSPAAIRQTQTWNASSMHALRA